MHNQAIFERYITFCRNNLLKNSQVLSSLKRHGIYENYIFENFCIGYSNGTLLNLMQDNDELKNWAVEMGILKSGKELFKSCITLPICDENNAVVNIIGYPIYANSKKRIISINDSGIFNQPFLKNVKEIILTDNPLEAFLLIQSDYPNTTFLFGSDSKYVRFINEHRIKKAIFTFDGKMRLFYELSKNGVSAKRVVIDFQKIKKSGSKEHLDKMLSGIDNSGADNTVDIIQEIENGFLFQFPHLNYRIIGNFSEHSMNMKANIKVYNQNDVFVDYAESETMPNREALNPIWK